MYRWLRGERQRCYTQTFRNERRLSYPSEAKPYIVYLVSAPAGQTERPKEVER